MAKSDYKWIMIFIAVCIIGAFGFIMFKTQVQQPLEEAKEKDNIIEQKDAQIAELEQRIKDIAAEKEVKVDVYKAPWWAWAAIILLIIATAVILYLIFYKPQFEEKVRHQIVEHMRKYAKEKDNIKVYHLVKYAEGYYKADFSFPVALVLFTTLKTWIPVPGIGMEPPAYSIYGYLTDKKRPDNVLEDFEGLSIKEVVESIKQTTWGMRTPHYKAYKTKSYEEEALKQYQAREETIREAVELKKAIEDRA